MSARVSMRLALALASGPCLAFGALGSFGCDDPLKSASLIEETRILGARLEVAGEPDRGSPAPGESAHFRLFVAAPNGEPNVSYGFAVCGVTPTNSGFPPCKTPPLAAAFQAQPGVAPPSFDFQVPAELDLSATPHGFVTGIVCPNGGAELSGDSGARCVDGAGDAVGFEFDFAGAGEDNGNPTLRADALEFDGAAWAATDAGADCNSLPQVGAKTAHRLRVQLQDGDFDSLVQMNSADPQRETLLLSQFCSAGKLAHTFVSLTPSTPNLAGEVGWDAPTQADPGGTLVHFYFVVRDSRGGEDLATRALCVVP